jgi:predicted lipid-binding transport protein (Tim44 family)
MLRPGDFTTGRNPMSTRSAKRAASWAAKWRLVFALFLCAGLALAPSLADARAGSSYHGGGSSFGSRGLRSFENNGASPLTRSVNPSPQATRPFGAPAPAYGGGSFFQRHPFLTGLFGGFLGSWLFHGLGGFGHVLGGLFTFLIIGLLIAFVIRLFAGRGFAYSGMGGVPRSVGAAAAPAATFRGRDVNVSDTDLVEFQRIHAAVQDAWSRGDLAQMRRLMTPEMLGYFSEELTKNSSQGVQNLVTNVNLLKGEVTEAWEEGDLEYATAYLRWSALDYTTRIGNPNQIVAGDPRLHSEAEEVWTFVRRRGGDWLLSAIQQV